MWEGIDISKRGSKWKEKPSTYVLLRNYLDVNGTALWENNEQKA